MIRRAAHILRAQSEKGFSKRKPLHKKNALVPRIMRLVRSPDTAKAIEEAQEVVREMTQGNHFPPANKQLNLLNMVFVRDRTGTQSDWWVQRLQQDNVDTTGYLLRWYLKRDQYEQAMELFWTWYAQRESTDFKMLNFFQAFKLLRLASERNDTEYITKFITTLDADGYIAPVNYCKILEQALCYRNAEICKLVYEKVNSTLNEECLAKLCKVFIEGQEFESAIQILPEIRDPDTRLHFCLLIVSETQSWQLLDQFCADDIELDYALLPPKFLSVPNLDKYENLAHHLEEMTRIVSEKVRRLILYSLLRSIDNNQGHFGSIVFTVSFLKRTRQLDLLDEPCIDTIFHNASKFGLKMGAEAIAILLRDKMTLQHYTDLIVCECVGTERGLAYMEAINCISKFHELGAAARAAIGTEEGIPTRFLNALDNNNIELARSIVDYEYLTKNWDNADDRQQAHLEETRKYAVKFDQRALVMLSPSSYK